MEDSVNPIILESFEKKHEAFLKEMEMIPSLWTFTHTLAQDLLDIQELPTTYAFIIKDRFSDILMGFTQIKDVDLKLKRGESGTRILPCFQGEGLNKYVKQALLGFAFNMLGLEEVYCLVNTHHEYSKKSLLKIGFEHIPSLDKLLVVGSTGIMVNFNYFSIAKNQWKLLQQKGF